ncbi:MAG: Hsp33 family molecular chaperone HslO, partial [Faecalibacillus sp.]
MKDYLVRGLVDSKNCRVFACQTTNLLDEARKKHGLWPTASAALGRMMSATLMMAAMNKNNEKMTITINGGGPIGTMMTVTHGDGHIKGFVGNPEVHYTYNSNGHLAVGVAVGNQGTLQVIKDMGLKEPFCGTVPLQTGEIGDDFSYYFMASEQIPSVVSLGVLVN